MSNEGYELLTAHCSFLTAHLQERDYEILQISLEW